MIFETVFSWTQQNGHKKNRVKISLKMSLKNRIKIGLKIRSKRQIPTNHRQTSLKIGTHFMVKQMVLFLYVEDFKDKPESTQSNEKKKRENIEAFSDRVTVKFLTMNQRNARTVEQRQ